ncbi:MAG: hypothetical protein QOE90_3166 [Thermoplasmata archaeon]|nr:hypothetical protein [Thermoplasmata archaeon]
MPVEPLSSLPSEVVLHELGETVASAAMGIHEELARHPRASGCYILDDLELTLPVRARLDELGQVLVSLSNDAAPGGATLRLRVRPSQDAPRAPLPSAPQPLSTLGLPHQAIEKLAAHRVFSVDDLMRISQTAAGRAALANLRLGASLDRALDKAAILALPTIPPALLEAIAKTAIKDPAGFLAADPARLAKDLAPILPEPIAPDVLRSWQDATRGALRVPGPVAPPPRAPARPEITLKEEP